MEQNLPKLPKSFYQDYVLNVAPKLLGKLIVTKNGGKFLCGMIVEVEAYDGAIDKAAHTYIGKTKRNEIMFQPGGFLYVYFTYGMHYCANVVAGNVNEGQACLIRAVEPVKGIEIMKENRFKTNKQISLINLTNGPAKFCSAFGIDRQLNGTDLSGDHIYLTEYQKITDNDILTSRRIGIKKSVELPWRFSIKDNPYVSQKVK